MPTEKPRITFTISQERLSEVEAYRFENKFKNQTQAILSLIDKGLSGIKKENPSDATEAEPGEDHLIQLYRELNTEGQHLVVDYADTMVASGKYIKTTSNKLGSEKLA